MKKVLGFILIISGTYFYAQSTHEVQPKDSPYSIAKKYNLSLQELYKLNPNLEGSTLSLGQKINVKKSGSKSVIKSVVKNTISDVKTSSKLATLIIQPKQTLYGITKQYHISEKELVQLNPHIAAGMKIGDNIQLPADLLKKYGNVTTAVVENTITSTDTASNSLTNSNTYVVQAKDTFYGIGRKFGVTKDKLLALNPGLEEKGLQPGETITILGNAKNVVENTVKTAVKPITESIKEEVVVDKTASNNNEYTVQEGDTIFSILNKFGLTWDELLALNPRLSAGLQTGMKLTVSKTKSTSTTSSYKKSNNTPLQMSILLPLSLDNSNYQFKQMSIDFLTGAKLAAKRYVASGKSLNMKIVDVGESSNIDKIVKNNNITDSDVIVGPFFKSNIISVLDEVKSKQIPVVSPFANSEDLYKYSNLIISETNKEVYAKRIAKEVTLSYSDETVYILSDKKNLDIAQEIENNLKASGKISKIKMVKSSNEIDLEKNMMTGQSAPISVVLCSDDAELGKNFTDKLINLSSQSKGMKSFSVFYHPIFEKQETQLSNTKLVYLMDRKINTDGDTEKEILNVYKKDYCKAPSKYAIIGYDVVSDILQRENDKAELFKNLSKVQTQLATKFEYEKSEEGAYLNIGYRVIRLNP